MRRRLSGRRTSATIGVFDGVHLGHQALIAETVRVARASNTTALAISFLNHPLSVLAPPYKPRSLNTPARKNQLLLKAGIDEVILVGFTPQFASTSPEDFIIRFLVEQAQISHLVCGYDFTYGYRGAGNIEQLRTYGDQHGFNVTCLNPILGGTDSIIVKSTQIRELLGAGKVRRAAHLLTRPHELPGIVVTGHQRGRTIGFPTANLHPPDHFQHPADGVYVCAARVGTSPQLHAAMVNIGTNPTFGEAPRTVEAHLLDFSQDIVGQEVSLFFLDKLRNEQKFSGVDALVDQLRRDESDTRSRWENHEVADMINLIPNPVDHSMDAPAS